MQAGEIADTEVAAIEGLRLVARLEGAAPQALHAAPEFDAAAGLADLAVLAEAAALLPDVDRPMIALWSGASALVDPHAGRAVLGRSGVNIAMVLRALGHMPAAARLAPPEVPEPELADPAHRAAWRLLALVDRTELPRQLEIDLPDGARAIGLARGGALAEAGPALDLLRNVMSVAGAGAELRFRIAAADIPDSGTPKISSIDLLRALVAAGDGASAASDGIGTGADCWPTELPDGIGFAMVSQALGALGLLRRWRRERGVGGMLRLLRARRGQPPAPLLSDTGTVARIAT